MAKLKSGIVAEIVKDGSERTTLKKVENFEITARKKGKKRTRISISFEIANSEIISDDEMELSEIKKNQVYFMFKEQDSDIKNSGDYRVMITDQNSPTPNDLSFDILIESSFHITGGGKVGGAGV